MLDSRRQFASDDDATQARRKRGAGGARALPLFGRSVNPISTRGAHYPHPVVYVPPRIFRPCDGPALILSKELGISPKLE